MEVIKTFSNAHFPILVTVLGMIVFLHPAMSLLEDFSITALQPSRESYIKLEPSTWIDSKEEPEKTDSLMFVTLDGMVIEVKLLQFWNLQLVIYQLVMI